MKAKKKSPNSTVPTDCCCQKKERKRVLQSNMSKQKLDLSNYDPFAARFMVALLKEQEEIEAVEEVPAVEGDVKAPEDFTPEANKEDFQKSLEPETNPEQFDVEGSPTELTTDTINSIREWSGKLDDFASFLNDPSSESLHKILADGDRAGSLLRGVTRKASDSITRIAGEVEKLKEILNTYIITAPKKLRDTEQLKAGA
jgi:predicted transcriptional regulator